eukprot:c29034_g1_i1.p1 GENE.c29034_g1_i1~~c29034_g1_i1.p1  ORF type:complete len:309 (+),score=48.13 c29034_g1_i1:96-1022(+)
MAAQAALPTAGDSPAAARRPPKHRSSTSATQLAKHRALTDVTTTRARSRSQIARSPQLAVDESKLHIPDDHRLMKGWMTKQGGKWKSWKKRWFVLTPLALRYFEKEDERVIKGTVMVGEMTFAERNFTEKTNCIAIGTIGRVYLIAAESAVDFEEWLGWLTSVIFVPPIPREPLESYQLWREALELGHKPTMARLLDPSRSMPKHSFEAMHDIGVPAMDDILLPPIKITTVDTLTTIVVSDRRYNTHGTVLVARSPAGLQLILSESWQPSISAHMALNTEELDMARVAASGAGASAQETDNTNDDESS